LLDDQSAQCDPDGQGLLAFHRFLKGLSVFFFDFPPKNQLGEFDPTIVFIQFAAKRQEKVIRQNKLVFRSFIQSRCLQVQGFCIIGDKNPCIRFRQTGMKILVNKGNFIFQQSLFISSFAYYFAKDCINFSVPKNYK